jgi:hypothetical protein
MEIKLVFFLALLAPLGWGIVAQSDKQSVHLLEGKLYRLGKSTDAARVAYKKHATRLAVVQFVFGFCLFCSALIATRREVAIVLGAVGALLILAGIVGRVRTFRRADQELH